MLRIDFSCNIKIMVSIKVKYIMTDNNFDLYLEKENQITYTEEQSIYHHHNICITTWMIWKIDSDGNSCLWLRRTTGKLFWYNQTYISRPRFELELQWFEIDWLGYQRPQHRYLHIYQVVRKIFESRHYKQNILIIWNVSSFQNTYVGILRVILNKILICPNSVRNPIEPLFIKHFLLKMLSLTMSQSSFACCKIAMYIRSNNHLIQHILREIQSSN